MEKTEFEKKFLELVYQSGMVITSSNVAYSLSMPIEEAQEHLMDLELSGTLQQASDQQGNMYYIMPNRPAPGSLVPLGSQAMTTNASQIAPGVANPADLPRAPVYTNPGAKGMNVNGMVINVVVPGLGSIICGHKNGWGMLGLVLLGLVLIFLLPGFSKLLAALPILGGWVWSIVAGVGLLNEKEQGPGFPQ